MRSTIKLLFCLLCAASTQAQTNVLVTEFGFSFGENNVKRLVTATGDTLFMNRAVNHQISTSNLLPHAVEVCTMTGLIRNRRTSLTSCSCIRTDDDGDEIMGFCQPQEIDGLLPVMYTGGTGKYEGITCSGLFGLNQSTNAGMAYTWKADTQLTCDKE